jgi:hypothetical protein
LLILKRIKAHKYIKVFKKNSSVSKFSISCSPVCLHGQIGSGSG